MRKIKILILCLLLSLSLLACSSSKKADTIILFTNDINSSDDKLNIYASIYQYLTDQKSEYGDADVVLVDGGDNSKGGMIAALSKGKWIVDIMDHIGYDIAIGGNDEFSYGIDNFMKLVEGDNDITYLAANLTDINGDDLLPSYTIKEYDGRKIAFIGILDPTTANNIEPSLFEDDKGNKIYDFYDEKNGNLFYERIQSVLDAISEEEPDLVIAIAHLGLGDGPYSSNALIENTQGIDILLDSKTHEVYDTLVKDKGGNDVMVAQGGEGEYITRVWINPDGIIDISQVKIEDIRKGHAYIETAEYIATIKDDYSALLKETIASTQFDLTCKDGNTEILIDKKETNLGDLIADAYRFRLDTDIALVTATGITNNIDKGKVTLENILNVFNKYSFLNKASINGQTLLDLLEIAYRNTPDGSASFLQISGLKLTIDTSIPSPVIKNEDGTFKIDEDKQRRVSEVYIYDVNTDDYLKLDPDKTYTVAFDEKLIETLGKVINHDETSLKRIVYDGEALVNYLSDTLDGKIPISYSDPDGDGRIEIIY